MVAYLNMLTYLNYLLLCVLPSFLDKSLLGCSLRGVVQFDRYFLSPVFECSTCSVESRFYEHILWPRQPLIGFEYCSSTFTNEYLNTRQVLFFLGQETMESCSAKQISEYLVECQHESNVISLCTQSIERKFQWPNC